MAPSERREGHPMLETQLDIVSQMYRGEVHTPGYTFVVTYAEKLNGDTVEFLHTHLYYEIYFVLENRIVSHVEGENHTLNKGDILFLAPKAKHHTVYEPGVRKEYFVLIFEVVPTPGLERLQPEYRMQYEEIRERLDIVDTRRQLVTRGGTDGMIAILESIREEKTERLIGWTDLLNSYLHHFFIHAIRAIEVGTPHSSIEKPPEKLNLGVDASKFMHGNYHRDISLEDAAEYLKISPRHVNRVFREVFGTTFSKTLSLLRLNYAKKHLSSTDHSIEKVSELVGFRTPRTLFKLFNQYEHMTVTEYRKKTRREEEAARNKKITSGFKPL